MAVVVARPELWRWRQQLRLGREPPREVRGDLAGERMMEGIRHDQGKERERESEGGVEGW